VGTARNRATEMAQAEMVQGQNGANFCLRTLIFYTKHSFIKNNKNKENNAN
jgi:hypothetical protein